MFVLLSKDSCKEREEPWQKCHVKWDVVCFWLLFSIAFAKAFGKCFWCKNDKRRAKERTWRFLHSSCKTLHCGPGRGKKMFTYCNVMCTQPTPLFSLVARCWWTTITFGATSWLKLGEQRDPSALKNWHVRSVDHVTLHFFCKHPLLWCWKCAGGEKEVRWRWPMLGHEQQLTSYVKLQICQSVFVYRISCGASSKDHVCQMVRGARLRSLMIFGGLVAFERSVVWNHIQIVAKGPSPESTTVSTSEQAKKAV